MALQVYGLLNNGMGGIDWAGLPFVCGALGVRNVEGLLQRLTVIKLHRRNRPGKDS